MFHRFKKEFNMTVFHVSLVHLKGAQARRRRRFGSFLAYISHVSLAFWTKSLTEIPDYDRLPNPELPQSQIQAVFALCPSCNLCFGKSL